MNYLEKHSIKEIYREQAILKNIIELIHLISRDSGYITNHETTKISFMMKIIHKIAKCPSHSNIPFYHYIANYSIAYPIRIYYIYF